MAYQGHIAKGYEPDDEKRIAIQQAARKESPVYRETPYDKYGATRGIPPFSLPFALPIGAVTFPSERVSPSREATGKIAGPQAKPDQVAKPAQGGTPAQTGTGPSQLSDVIPWDEMARAQRSDTGSLNAGYRQALQRGTASEFVKGKVPDWGASEMRRINEGIRTRGKSGVVLSAVPSDANLSVMDGGEDYFAQHRLLQEIDPERYGYPDGGVARGGLPAGYTDLDTGSMSLGQLAATAAKNRALLKSQTAGQERRTALDVARMQASKSGVDDAARARLYSAQAGVAESQLATEQRRQSLLSKLGDVEYQKTDPSGYARVAAMYEKMFGTKEKVDPIELERMKASFAAGVDPRTGEALPGYADGGVVGEYGAPPRMHTGLLAEYGQYLQSAAQAKVQPVPFAQYVGLMSKTRGQMAQTPSQYADGGEVEDDTPMGAIDVSGRHLKGPGTGRSDSIPAVIDGSRPAALSTGEFVIPAHVVRAKGTEFFDKLIAQYADDKGQGDGE